MTINPLTLTIPNFCQLVNNVTKTLFQPVKFYAIL